MTGAGREGEMHKLTLEPARRPLTGELRVPGDKSISHRALMLGALSKGASRIRGLPSGDDVARSRRAVEALGVRLRDEEDDALLVEGAGMAGLVPPLRPIDCGGSATTARLLAGITVGRGFSVTITGDETLSRRPMGRIVEPLRRMKAEVSGKERDGEVFLPLVIAGAGALEGRHYVSPVASAQVKSCLLLAGLRARGTTAVTEPAESRDHTEVMLAARGLKILHRGLTVSLQGPVGRLDPLDMEVPGDPSSAAFLLVAALLTPGSHVEVEQVCLNPTRIGFVHALRRMGAAITVEEPSEQGGEVVGRLVARGGECLCAVEIEAGEVPSLIDEIPILAVAASLADGESRFRGCGELRAKESDRLRAIVSMLRGGGVEAEAREDTLIIQGTRGRPPRGGGFVRAGEDHRMAMAAVVMGLVSAGKSEIWGAASIDASYPGFLRDLRRLGARL